jgi:hypothetical protein
MPAISSDSERRSSCVSARSILVFFPYDFQLAVGMIWVSKPMPPSRQQSCQSTPPLFQAFGYIATTLIVNPFARGNDDRMNVSSILCSIPKQRA